MFAISTLMLLLGGVFFISGCLSEEVLAGTHSTPGTYAENIPAHAINITAEVWGGGGGGGGAANTFLAYGASGGGGSGGYIKKNFGNSQAASTISVTVGHGGPRGEAGNNGGAVGGFSSTTYGGITITANGGNPGGGAPGNGEGSGGSGGTTSNNGDVNTTGNSGTAGCCSGGGLGKNSGQGGNAPNGGAGGSSVGGSTGFFNGQAGGAPGGGGGGGRSNYTNSVPGGVGGVGRVIISYGIFTAGSYIQNDWSGTGLTNYSAAVTIPGNFTDVKKDNLAQIYVRFDFGGGNVVSVTPTAATNTEITINYPISIVPATAQVSIAYTDNQYGFTDWVTNSVDFIYDDPYLNISGGSVEYLSLSYSPLLAAPANGVLAVKTSRTVSTNNPTGYSLYLTPQDAGLDLVCSENSLLTIPTVATAGSLDVGTYGYKESTIDQNGVNSDWLSMSSNQLVKNIIYPIDNDPINIWFGFRLDASVAACSSYTKTFVWTAIGNLLEP